MLIQYFIVLFAVFVLFRVFTQYRQKHITGGWFAAWVVFWFIVGLVVLWPELTDRVAQFVGVGRGADLVTYVSLAVIFYVLFRIMSRLEQLNVDISKLTEEDAINRAHHNEDK